TVAELAARLRGAVAARRIEHPCSGAGPHVTVSVGVGVIRPEIDRTPQGLLQLADEALYEAKDAGRNRCVIKGGEDYRSLVTGEYRKRDLRTG
ncbi:MAG TPA: diguanylate cyclase, partial [Woeseiaceae bacterium]|nr:diguanylate cyclase [Woeseiaceae bacterium]